MRPDRPNRADRRLPGGAAGIAAIAAAATLISACTTGTSGDGTPTGGSTAVPSSPPPTALSTATLPTDSGAPSALPSDSTPVTSAGPSTTAPSTPPASSTRPVGRVGIHLSFYDWSAAQQVAEVGANVEGKVIRDGSCTLTLRLDSVTRTVSRRAIITPSSTSCGVLTIPGSRLGPGDWTAVVSFTAPTARGSSDPVTITVPR